MRAKFEREAGQELTDQFVNEAAADQLRDSYFPAIEAGAPADRCELCFDVEPAGQACEKHGVHLGIRFEGGDIDAALGEGDCRDTGTCADVKDRIAWVDTSGSGDSSPGGRGSLQLAAREDAVGD